MDSASLVSLVIFSRRKAYRYMCCSGLCLLYSILYSVVNKPPVGLIDTAFYEVTRVCEMAVPALLLATVYSLCRKQRDGKRNFVPAVIAGLICAARISKFIWARHYFNMLLSAGESAFELTQLGILGINIHAIVISFLFFALNISLIWHLRKYAMKVS